MHRMDEGCGEENTQNLRKAVEHRATWFYLLMDEARKRGVDWEEMARDAVFRCGCIHGGEIRSRCQNPEDLRDFEKAFLTEAGKKVFAMEVVTSTEDELEVHFHYCPLVEAWEKLGCSRDDLALLCDIAMDGDRGIASRFDAFAFELGDTLAGGHPACILKFSKK